MTTQTIKLSTRSVWLIKAFVLLAVYSLQAETVSYQFYHDRTNPTSQGWESYSSYGTETLLKNALEITDTSSAKDGYWYKKSISYSSYYAFQARIRFRFVDCSLPPTPSDEHAFLLGIANGTKDHGCLIKLGMVQTDAGTKIGFVNTDGVFFGNAYTSSSPDFIEVELTKPVGNGAAMTVKVDGVTTPISEPATSTQFTLLGSQNFRYLTFGMYGISSVGTVQIIGCTGGEGANPAPPIILPPIATSISNPLNAQHKGILSCTEHVSPWLLF